jgi:antitoxin (DNA-binding transcriptional repressor) of toxin-antitoxin stability system
MAAGTIGTLANMTTYDYLMTMEERERIRVPVAQLKAKLSEHLRAVQAGSTMIVVSHDLPVALLSPPPGTTPNIVVRRPDKGSPLQPPMGADILDLLRQERADR